MTFSQVLLVHISLCCLGSTHHIRTKPLVKTMNGLQQIPRENWRSDLIVMAKRKCWFGPLESQTISLAFSFSLKPCHGNNCRNRAYQGNAHVPFSPDKFCYWGQDSYGSMADLTRQVPKYLPGWWGVCCSLHAAVAVLFSALGLPWVTLDKPLPYLISVMQS